MLLTLHAISFILPQAILSPPIQYPVLLLNDNLDCNRLRLCSRVILRRRNLSFELNLVGALLGLLLHLNLAVLQLEDLLLVFGYHLPFSRPKRGGHLGKGNCSCLLLELRGLQLLLAALRDDLAPHGINVISVSIENIDFTDAFTNAVEAKQVATQDKQRAQTEQERMTMEEEAAAKRAVIIANAEAEKAKIAAQADLEVVKIQAEAALYAGEKEAEMNKRISEALSDGLIKYYWIKQWNGKLPTVTTNSSMTLIDMEDVIGEE